MGTRISSLFYPILAPSETQKIESKHYVKLLLFNELEVLKEPDKQLMFWSDIQRYLEVASLGMTMYDMILVQEADLLISPIRRRFSTVSWPNELGVVLRSPDNAFF